MVLTRGTFSRENQYLLSLRTRIAKPVIGGYLWSMRGLVVVSHGQVGGVYGKSHPRATVNYRREREAEMTKPLDFGTGTIHRAEDYRHRGQLLNPHSGGLALDTRVSKYVWNQVPAPGAGTVASDCTRKVSLYRA